MSLSVSASKSKDEAFFHKQYFAQSSFQNQGLISIFFSQNKKSEGRDRGKGELDCQVTEYAKLSPLIYDFNHSGYYLALDQKFEKSVGCKSLNETEPYSEINI